MEKLNEQANRLARLLRNKGAHPTAWWGIMVERSVEMVAGIWGVLKASQRLPTINPAAPEDRLTYMLDNANVTILLTQEKFIEKFENRTK